MSNRRPRRSRFTVTGTARFSNAVEKKVALAYDAAGARRVMESLGWTVLEVHSGDYRVPSAPLGAKVNMLSVRTAIKELGLRCPVEIKMSNRAQFQRGLHQAVPTDPSIRQVGKKVYGAEDAAPDFKHVITIAAKQTADAMGETVWHELTHALQVERECIPGAQNAREVLQRIKAIYRDGTTYEAKRWEREANAAMANNARLPLARQGSR